MRKLTPEQVIYFAKAVNCDICEKPLPKQSLENRVRDHCHLTGQYRGPAHENCNLKFHAPDFF